MADPVVNEYGPKKGKAGLPLNVIGEDLDSHPNAKIRFGGSDSPVNKVLNAQHIQAEVPAGIPDGVVAVSLAYDDFGPILIGGFTIGKVPAGTAITDVYPATLSGGDTVSIFGYGFTAGHTVSEVTFNGAPVPVVSTNDTLVQVTAPPGRPGTAVAIAFNFSDGTSAPSPIVPVYS